METFHWLLDNIVDSICETKDDNSDSDGEFAIVSCVFSIGNKCEKVKVKPLKGFVSELDVPKKLKETGLNSDLLGIFKSGLSNIVSFFFE